MHYLGLALYAEGSTDYQFLSPIIQRATEDICLKSAVRPVDISEVIPVDHLPIDAGAPRPDRVVSAARQHYGAWRIVLVHGDGSGNPTAARANLVSPALVAVAAEFPACRGVGVVPVRETEAWALCDGDALRKVFNTTLDDNQLGIPASVEADLDPKATLRSVFLATNPSPQRRRQGVGSTLSVLAGAISLDRLRTLRSYRAMESDLDTALRSLGIFS